MKRMDDRVTELRVAVVPIGLDEPFAAGRWVLDSVYNVVVELRGASGSSGIGYAFVFTPADAQTIAAAAQALRDQLLGRDPLDSQTLQTDLRAATNFVGAG